MYQRDWLILVACFLVGTIKRLHSNFLKRLIFVPIISELEAWRDCIPMLSKIQECLRKGIIRLHNMWSRIMPKMFFRIQACLVKGIICRLHIIWSQCTTPKKKLRTLEFQKTRLENAFAESFIIQYGMWVTYRIMGYSATVLCYPWAFYILEFLVNIVEKMTCHTQVLATSRAQHDPCIATWFEVEPMNSQPQLVLLVSNLQHKWKHDFGGAARSVDAI